MGMPVKSNLLWKYRGLNYSSIFSIALQQGDYGQLLDFLNDIKSLTRKEYYSIEKALELYLDHLKSLEFLGELEQDKYVSFDENLERLLEIRERLELVVVRGQ